MVDGIIGEVLSNLEAHERIGQGFDSTELGCSQEDFDGLSPDEQHEAVQDWVIGVEVEAEMKHNPISVRGCELERHVRFLCSVTWFSYPNADNAKSLQDRRMMLDNAILIGCRCSLHDGMALVNGKVVYHPCKYGPIIATVRLPNFKTPGCTSTLGLVENLAKLVALEKARKVMEDQGG